MHLKTALTCWGMDTGPLGVSCCVWYQDFYRESFGFYILGWGLLRLDLFWHIPQMLNQIGIWEMWRPGFFGLFVVFSSRRTWAGFVLWQGALSCWEAYCHWREPLPSKCVRGPQLCFEGWWMSSAMSLHFNEPRLRFKFRARPFTLFSRVTLVHHLCYPLQAWIH